MLSPLQFVTTGPNRDYLQRTTQGGLHRRHTDQPEGAEKKVAKGHKVIGSTNARAALYLIIDGRPAVVLAAHGQCVECLRALGAQEV